jgi:hypothetical protein
VEHILWRCGSARDVWLESTKKLQKSTNAAMSFSDIFAELADKLDPKDLQLFAVIARQLWLRRNTYVFGGPLTSPTTVIRQAWDQMESFDRANTSRSRGASILTKPIPVKWQKPPEG